METQRRKFSREFELEAAKLVPERGVSVLTPRSRLVDERYHDRPARHRRTADGRQWRHLLDEPVGQRPGQRGDEKPFSSMKTERIGRKTYRVRNQANADVFDYIERFYSLTRRHSTLGCLSPLNFERGQIASLTRAR